MQAVALFLLRPSSVEERKERGKRGDVDTDTHTRYAERIKLTLSIVLKSSISSNYGTNFLF